MHRIAQKFLGNALNERLKPIKIKKETPLISTPFDILTISKKIYR